MPPRVSALIALVLLGLLGGAGAFIRHRLEHPPQLALVTPTAVEPDPLLAAPLMTTVGQLTLGSINQFQDVVQRPLFASNRRPPPPPIPDEPEPLPQAPPEPVDERDYLLIGVMVTPDATTALLRDDQSSISRVQEGDRLDDWQVMQIYDDHVVLRQGSRVKEVPLLRNQAAATTMEQQTAPQKGQNMPVPTANQEDPRELRRRLLEQHRALRQRMQQQDRGQDGSVPGASPPKQ